MSTDERITPLREMWAKATPTPKGRRATNFRTPEERREMNERMREIWAKGRYRTTT
jgi:hypothetical protein